MQCIRGFGNIATYSINTLRGWSLALLHYIKLITQLSFSCRLYLVRVVLCNKYISGV